MPERTEQVTGAGGSSSDVPARRDLRYARARLYESLRSAHLERAHQFAPASIVFHTRRYDFDEKLLRGLDVLQTSRWRAALIVARTRLDVLEVNEPFLVEGLKTTALTLAAISIREAFGYRAPAVVTYAIDNLDPFDRQSSNRWRSRAHRYLYRALSRYVWRRLDRIAYGTTEAMINYRRSMPRSRRLHELHIPALAAACPCPPRKRDTQRVIFLGALTDRKGFPQLVEAWKTIRVELPEARLTILGKGPLEEAAAQLAQDDNRVFLCIDPPRALIHDELRRSQVLALPSRRRPSWREQVGLPIVEGLSHGCSIVTTDQTGLAAWLRSHDHSVLEADAGGEALATAIVEKLRHPREPAEVTADLPKMDGRKAADDWLLGGRRLNLPAAPVAGSVRGT